MDTLRNISCEPVAISATPGNKTAKAHRDHERPNIEVHLRDSGEENQTRDIVIDRFPFVIGRRLDCDYQLNHGWVSRRHCCFFLEGDKVWLQDLASTNGTYLNGKRIADPEAVREGDLITLPFYSFHVSLTLVIPC